MCYKKAIKVEERHHNAWFGLGNIAKMQEKYDEAGYNLKKASEINPNSTISKIYLGINYSH